MVGIVISVGKQYNIVGQYRYRSDFPDIVSRYIIELYFYKFINKI